MVKDCWSHFPVCMDNQSINNNAIQVNSTTSTMIQSQKTPSSTVTSNKEAASLSNNPNPWGDFKSREHFIEMHIC